MAGCTPSPYASRGGNYRGDSIRVRSGRSASEPAHRFGVAPDDDIRWLLMQQDLTRADDHEKRDNGSRGPKISRRGHASRLGLEGVGDTEGVADTKTGVAEASFWPWRLRMGRPRSPGIQDAWRTSPLPSHQCGQAT